MTWRIEPAKVQEVLSAVQPKVKTLSTLLTAERLESIPAKLEPGAPVTAEAPAAMQALLADQSDELQRISWSVGAGIQGVYNATIAYVRGNEEMAATFQREMRKAARTGDFSYFDEHGYKG